MKEYDSGQRLADHVKLHIHTRPQSDAAVERMASTALGTDLDGSGVTAGGWMAVVCNRPDPPVLRRREPIHGRGSGYTFGGDFCHPFPAAQKTGAPQKAVRH